MHGRGAGRLALPLAQQRARAAPIGSMPSRSGIEARGRGRTIWRKPKPLTAVRSKGRGARRPAPRPPPGAGPCPPAWGNRCRSTRRYRGAGSRRPPRGRRRSTAARAGRSVDVEQGHCRGRRHAEHTRAKADLARHRLVEQFRPARRFQIVGLMGQEVAYRQAGCGDRACRSGPGAGTASSGATCALGSLERPRSGIASRVTMTVSADPCVIPWAPAPAARRRLAPTSPGPADRGAARPAAPRPPCRRSACRSARSRPGRSAHPRPARHAPRRSRPHKAIQTSGSPAAFNRARVSNRAGR